MKFIVGPRYWRTATHEIYEVEKPKTNREAFKLVLELVGSSAALATGLGVTRQLTNRWDEIPPRHLETTCELTELAPDIILPELASDIADILHISDYDAGLLLPELIRVILQPKANPWQSRKKPRKSRK